MSTELTEPTASYINKKKHNKTKKSIRNKEPIKQIIKDDVVGGGGTGSGDKSFLPLSMVGWIKFSIFDHHQRIIFNL